jgi:ribonuclease HI
MPHKIDKDYTYKCFFDGSATPNPGHMQIGGYIQAKHPDSKVVYKYSKPMGVGTNNEAEYHSLIKLVNEIRRRGIKKVKIFGDSKLVVNQVNGIWKAKDRRMQVLRDRAREALTYIDEWSLIQIPRKQNSRADKLT